MTAILVLLNIGLHPEMWPFLAAAVVVLGGLWSFHQWLRPKLEQGRKDLVASRDSILGRDEVVDSITGEVRIPALPGIGVRMANQEAQMEVLTSAVAKIADSHSRLDAMESAQDDLKARVSKLEQATVERIVARADSAAAFRAIEAVATQGVIDAEASEEEDPPDADPAD